jgi:predicted acylesterase/phospholipase RssA
VKRSRFLATLASVGAAPALVAAGAEDTAETPLTRALVLSGGGARGAYEAGVIGELAAAAGIGDGSPLAPYEVVCGTSIGALNGWFVATGQYERLRELWYTVGGQNLIRLKSRYAALHDPESGAIDRAVSAISLISLARNQRAVLQSEPVYDWIVQHIDPTTPLVIPLVWAVTNLTQQRSEYFFVRPVQNADLPRRVVHALKILLGPHTIVREATPDLLHKAIFASTAIPIAFDPVSMPGPDGTLNAYCDGGVASNSPVAIAHALANSADVVLLDPPFEPEEDYRDAVEIAFGAYGTMQRKILESEMRNAYFQSLGRRALGRLTPAEIGRATKNDELLANFVQSIHATELRYVRPQKTLPVGVVGFEDVAGIGNAYRVGWEDAGRGFTRYDWRTFEL